MGMTIKQSDINLMLKINLEKSFKNKDFNILTNLERRKCIFEYLVLNNEYDYELLNRIYAGDKRMFADEIVSVLNPENKNKGVCNSFSYAYKLLLDKLSIPSIIVVCDALEKSLKNYEDNGVSFNYSKIKKDENGFYKIPHMLVLVQNDDKTFSFDDITYAIFNKGTDKAQDFFNYDLNFAKEKGQVNFQGIDTVMLRNVIKNSKDTISDILFRNQFKINEKIGFLNIPKKLISKCKITKDFFER